MHLFITGGTGFVGGFVCRRLLDDGYRLTVASRHAPRRAIDHPDLTYIQADTTAPGKWQRHLAGVDGVVNLAGASIFTRWNAAVKQRVRHSRLATTANLVDVLPHDRPVVLVSTSAVGYYGDRGEERLAEESGAGDDFLALLAQDWESAALRATERGARVVLLRLGIVLGAGGGAMQQMLPAFRAFVGGALGSGRQWFPWVHAEDVARTVSFALGDARVHGPLNVTAPGELRQGEFARRLGAVLGRPAVVPLPGFVLRTVLGEFGRVLLASQRVAPRRLLACGFQFAYPEVDAALRQIAGASPEAP